MLRGKDRDRLAEINPRGDDLGLRAAPVRREYQAIVARIAHDRPGPVLDWGCGYGHISRMLVDAGLAVTSFDYADEVEQDGPRALERFPELEVYLSSDPRRLPYPDGAFGAVLSCGVLEHVEDPAASLVELRRVLRPGGTLYVYKLPNRFSYLEKIAKRAGLYYHGKLPNDRTYDLRSARALLEAAHYEVVEGERANLVPLSLTGTVATRLTPALWSVNRALSRTPGLNVVATDLQFVARARA